MAEQCLTISKNEDDIRNEDNLKNEDDHKNEDDLKNEDSLKNEEDLKDNIKDKLAQSRRWTFSALWYFL